MSNSPVAAIYVAKVLTSDWVTKTIPVRVYPQIDKCNNLHVAIWPKGDVCYANGTWKSFTVELNEKDS